MVTSNTFINSQTCYLPENSAADTVLSNTTTGNGAARVAATDPDAGDSTTLVFSVTGGTGASYFDVDPSTGALSKSDSTSMDYEGGTTSWTVEITVTDSGGLTDSATYTVQLTDVNEAPVFSSTVMHRSTYQVSGSGAPRSS